MELLKKVQAFAIKNNIGNFDQEKYRRNQLLLFLAADLCQTASMDIMEQLKPVGLYKFEDKQAIETIKRLSGSLVGDIDAFCSDDYACQFGDIADELHTLITSYLKNKSVHHAETNCTSVN